MTKERVRGDGYRVVNWRYKIRITVNPDRTQTVETRMLPIWGWRRGWRRP